MDFKTIFDQLGAHYNAERFERITRKIYELEKRICHDDFDASTAYVAEELRNAGFVDVERIEHPADGVSCVNDSVMPEAWNLDGRAYLKVVSPWQDDERIIADTDEVPYAALTWSGATPDCGCTGELIEYDPENISSVAGKWVLYNGLPTGRINQPLLKAGALGIVATDFEQGWHNPDSTRWMNGQGTWGWYPLKGEKRLPIFAITARRALALKNELKAGHKVVLEGLLKARISDGVIYTVTGVIPGESKEEYGLLAHMYEPFLSDDCSGVAAGIEIGRMIKEAGFKLKKSLRVVFSFEHYGFVFYLAKHKHNLRAAMNMDMLATTMYRDLGIPLEWRMSTLGTPFFGDMLMLEILKKITPQMRIDCVAGNLSDDTIGGESSYNVPTNWLFVNNDPSPLHHSSAPIFADVDWVLAEKVSKMVATFAVFLLSAEKSDYMQLKPALVSWAHEKASDYANDTAYQRKVRCDFAEGQLASVNAWMPEVFTQDEIREAFADIRLPNDELPVVTENEKTASRMFVTRIEPGTPWSLNKIPYAERDYCNGRINKVYYTLLDGSRSLLEAVRMTDAISNSKTSDASLKCVINFMNYLERYGYVKIENK